MWVDVTTASHAREPAAQPAATRSLPAAPAPSSPTRQSANQPTAPHDPLAGILARVVADRAVRAPALTRPSGCAPGVVAVNDLPLLRGGGRPLPAPTREKMEAAFETDLSGVRIHPLGGAARLHARALTRGEHIHLDPASMGLTSSSSRELLGEELAHTIQQRQGRVTGIAGGVAVNVDAALEHEARTAGARAARGEAAAVGGRSGVAAAGRLDDVVQGHWLTDWLWSMWATKPTVAVYVPPPLGFVRTPNTGTSAIVEKREGAREAAFDDSWNERASVPQRDEEKYLATFCKRFGLEFPDLLKGIERDLRRMLAIMVDKDAVETRLVALDRRVGEIRREGGPSGLSALKEFEREFGFSLNQVIPLSVLPGSVFPKYMGRGVVPKDIGAGMPHGEMSHRLQWIAIMQDYADNPREWLLTPLDLLTLMNKKRFGWVQGVVMDQAQTTPREGYTHPDNVLHYMRTDADTQERLPNLSAAIVRRWDKRVDAAVDAVNAGKGSGSLDKALNEAYEEKKVRKGWTVEGGEDENPTTHIKLPWKVLLPPALLEEPTLPDRVRQQAEKQKSTH